MEFIKLESAPCFKEFTVFISLFSSLIFNIYTINQFKSVIRDIII
jgi:hypothetical protein